MDSRTRIDEDGLCAELFLDDSMFNALIFDAWGDGMKSRVLRVRFDVVSVFTFNVTLRLFYGLRVYVYAGLVLG